MTDERLYIRVSQELRARLEVGAGKEGVSINQYVNRLLEKGGDQDEFKEIVVELLHDIDDRLEDKSNNKDSAVNVEILMYLRLLSTPEQRKKVNSELDRLGYSPVRFENE